MNQEIFFTLADYKQNYERLKNEFVDAYVDNDEEEFISSQVDWYQRCLDNTILKHGILGDSIGWDTKAKFSPERFVGVVDKKIRNERGLDQEAIQNLNVSFGKIVKFLKKKLNVPIPELTAARAMLYHFILQEAKLEPPFPDGRKEKALETLSIRYGLSKDNLKKKYNIIMPSDGKSGYNKEDSKIVRELIRINNPVALPVFENITKHILI